MTLPRKVDWDVYARPHFAFGMYRAACEAVALGIKRISVIEFGVAGGNGLLAIEEIANDISQHLDIEIDIYGFDTGEGMPAPKDYRDLSHIWREGFYKMDVPALRRRLLNSTLILGNVSETVQEFANRDISPVGFIAFDLDYYSSTTSALALLRLADKHFLPRTYCYFDDIVGGEWDNHCEDIGVLCAIKEFNLIDKTNKLFPIFALNLKRFFSAQWNIKMYINHRFDHPLYGEYLTPDLQKSLPLN